MCFFCFFQFSENIFLNDLASNFKIVELLNSNDFVDWEIDYKYVNIFYDKIINSEIYDYYMESKINSFKDWLVFYNNLDVLPLAKAINNSFSTFFEIFSISTFLIFNFPI